MTHRLATAVGLALLIVVAVGPLRATAHAVLLRSTPPTGQPLSRPPDSVQLLFSEPIDPVFSRVQVLDPKGQAVDNGDAHVDTADDHLLVVTLKSGLPNAVYTVSWRSLSTIDVHPDEGQYPLFVGVPVPAGTAVDTSSAGQGAEAATPETTLGRWWFYVAATLFGGVLAAWKFVLGPVLAGPYADSRATVRKRAYRFIVVGGVLLVLGTVYTALAQAAAAADVPFTSAVGQPLADLLLRGRFASIWWPRIGLELISLLLIAFGGLEGLASECVLATLPAVLLTSSLTSHGAALPTLALPGIAIDWLHILGATAWVGGLVGLLICLPVAWRADKSSDLGVLPRLLARFGRFAVFASAIVIVSGVLQAILEVGSWAGLITTVYGELVLVKIVLVAGMLLLAGFNEWRARTAAAVAAGSDRRVGGLRRGVRAELALGIVVLGVAAVLTGAAPTPALPPAPGLVQLGQAVVR